MRKFLFLILMDNILTSTGEKQALTCVPSKWDGLPSHTYT